MLRYILGHDCGFKDNTQADERGLKLLTTSTNNYHMFPQTTQNLGMAKPS